MGQSRLRVGVLFGGRSCEHEVSVRSARAVIAAMDRERYEPVALGVARSGRWRLLEPTGLARLRAVDDDAGREVVLAPRPCGARLLGAGAAAARRAAGAQALDVDVVFPLIHGPLGEDGSVQGLLDLAGLPYVGSGVLGSAVGMDKAIMKSLFLHAGFPVGEHRVVLRSDWWERASRVRRACEAALRYPVFVKPANLGSSVGVSPVRDASELAPALDEAARYDRKIIVEAAVARPREIEVAVLGNESPCVSVAGEIVPDGDFYDYASKYESAGTRLVVPADLPPLLAARIRYLALRAFAVLDCAGLARVDFLVRGDDHAVFLNEVNTLPGFTDVSMYPRLWKASGLGFPALIDRLIGLALERHADRRENRTALRRTRDRGHRRHARGATGRVVA